MATTSDPKGTPRAATDSSTDPGTLDRRVEKLAQKWQDLQDNGQNASVETVCSDYPELAPAVLAWIAKFGKMEGLLATQAPSTDTLRGSWSADNVLAAPQGPDELGRLGGYRVLKLIGQGGMGKVYLAEDVQLKRRVALKVLLKGGDQRFLKEAQTLARIEHDHIVTIYQIGEDRGTQYLAMPYLQGETLEHRLKKTGRLPLAESVRIAKQVTQGLAAAHQCGIIHRDIKPSNIWLEGETDRVKILDFGLARNTDGETILTQEGAVVGTPAFMAPEQAAGLPVDHRADLFSLGCVLYQLISGVSPFARKDILSTLRALELETPELPTVKYPDTPGPLSDLAMALLAKKPDQRPKSAQSVLETLVAIEKDMASGTTAATGALASSDLASNATETTAPLRRHIHIAGGIALAACLAVLAYMLWAPPQTSNQDGNDKKPMAKQPNVVAVAPKDKKAGAEPTPAAITSVAPPAVDLAGVERRDFKIDVELPDIKEDKNGVVQLVEGENLRFKITVDEDAYVGIWYQMDDGSVKQLFPNRWDRDHQFQKGKTYSVPSNDSYTVTATPSKKPERFYVAASTKRWDWNPDRAEDDGYRMFRDMKDFDENLRGVVLVANAKNPRRVSQLSMPVWVSPK